MYGLEMVRASSKLKRGTIYVLLDRMEDKGLVKSWKEAKRANVAGMPRRLYKITGLGQRALHAWQTAEATMAAPHFGGAT